MKSRYCLIVIMLDQTFILLIISYIQSIAKAADSVSNVTDMRITLKEQRAAKALYTVPVDLDPKLSPLYESLTMYCGNKVQSNWEKRLHFAVFRASPHLFYVKLESYTMYESDPSDEKEFLRWLVPNFERTRLVELFEYGSKLYMKCSCKCRRRHV